MDERNIPLTAAEIGCVWNGYMNDSMSKHVLSYMLKHIKDEDIKVIVQLALDISLEHLDILHALFTKENYAVPNGFTDKDVNMDAPWLFTDAFCLTYVNQMAKSGLIAYGGSLALSARQDIREYFNECLTQTATLYNRSTETALNKGLQARHPIIEVPKETDYVNSKKYYSGLNPFSQNRPLNSIEISHLYMNTMTNSMGMKLSIAFAQTSPSKEIQEFMLRGKEISKKHTEIFSKTLLECDIETPQHPDMSISESTTQTFSDKLMMFHMSLLSATGIGNYATAAAASQRTDLAIDYERLSLEISKFAKSGADIMIEHGWLEQPPGTKNRLELVKKKED